MFYTILGPIKQMRMLDPKSNNDLRVSSTMPVMHMSPQKAMRLSSGLTVECFRGEQKLKRLAGIN